MTILISDKFSYPAGLDVATGTANGGTGFTGKWNAQATTGGTYDTVINAAGLSFYGAANTGNSLKLWTKGDGSHYQHADRSFSAAIPNTAASIIYLAFLINFYQIKSAATLKIAGLTTDAAGTIDATILNIGAISPYYANFNSANLFSGDAAYKTHLLIFKFTMSGAAGTPIKTDCYVDPNTSGDPKGWKPKTTSSALYVPTDMTKIYYDSGRSSSALTGDINIDELIFATTIQEAAQLTLTPPNPGQFMALLRGE